MECQPASFPLVAMADVGRIREDQSKRVKHVCTFHDERSCKNRSVTSLDWSPKFPELSVAAYNRNGMSMSDPNGMACVWNLHLVDRPEFVFHSQVGIAPVVPANRS